MVQSLEQKTLETSVRKVLLSELVDRKSRNPRYSLRAFARALSLAPGTLSSVIQGKRSLPARKVEKVCSDLKLKGAEKKAFLNSIGNIGNRKKTIKRFRYEKTVSDLVWQEVVSDPLYFTALSVFNLSHAKIEPEFLAKKLGISSQESKSLLRTLFVAGLVKIENGYYTLRSYSHQSRDNVCSESIKAAHQKSLKVAAEKLYSIDIDRRDYLSIKIPTNTKKIDLAKKEIRKFLVKMNSLLSEGEKTEVYELCVQLFPRTTLAEEIK